MKKISRDIFGGDGGDPQKESTTKEGKTRRGDYLLKHLRV